MTSAYSTIDTDGPVGESSEFPMQEADEPKPEPPVMDYLRERTAPAHRAVESTGFSGALGEGRPAPERYRSWLESLRQMHGALEERAADSDDPRVRAVWSDDRRRSQLVDDDLALLDELGVEPVADHLAPVEACVDWIESISATEFLGALYTFEGSSLGGVMIADRIGEHRTELAEATNFLVGYGDRTRKMWQSFGEAMNAEITHPPAIAECGGGAIGAFRHNGALLDALSADDGDE